MPRASSRFSRRRRAHAGLRGRRRDEQDHPGRHLDPQEVIARAKALSAELGTPITPGFEALVFKASRGIEDIYELTLHPQGRQPLPGGVSVTALRDEQDAIIGYLLIGTDNTARKQIEGEQKQLSSACATSVLHAIPVRIQHRRADDHRSVRHHHRCQ